MTPLLLLLRLRVLLLLMTHMRRSGRLKAGLCRIAR